MPRRTLPCKPNCIPDAPCKVCRDRACKLRYQRRYQEDGRSQANKDKHRDAINRRQRASRGVLEPATFDAHLAAQQGKCWICESTHRLCLDHNHSTGAARGVLCRDCNLRVGAYFPKTGGERQPKTGPFSERPERFERARLYMQTFDIDSAPKARAVRDWK